MKTLIALVRHGVTDWNYDGRGQGHSDIELNHEGRLQAEAVAAKLTPEHWDAVYSSPLVRARATAEAIAQRAGLPIRTDIRLIERNLGRCEGLTGWECQARFGTGDWKAFPDAEQDEAVADRAHAVLTELAGAHPGGRIVCVSHGGLIAVFFRTLRGGGSVHTRNTSVSRVWFDGKSFTPDGPTDYGHLLLDGIEYSAEKGRLRPRAVADLVSGGATPEEADRRVMQASAVESAWSGEEMVGVLAASILPDGQIGMIDTFGTKPGFDRTLDTMRSRLTRRFHAVSFR